MKKLNLHKFDLLTDKEIIYQVSIRG